MIQGNTIDRYNRSLAVREARVSGSARWLSVQNIDAESLES